jgi:hypothetical protein
LRRSEARACSTWWATPRSCGCGRSSGRASSCTPSGATLAAGLDLAATLTGGVIVMIFPDSGSRYLSERFWDEPRCGSDRIDRNLTRRRGGTKARERSERARRTARLRAEGASARSAVALAEAEARPPGRASDAVRGSGGRPKLASARARLTALNPTVRIETHDTALTSANALALFRDYDVVVDGADNFATRYLVNDACVLTGKPNAYGSIFRFEGQASVFGVPGGPCYRCAYPEPPPPGLVPSCAEGGVLGVLPGVIGTIQATEAIKLLLGGGSTLAGRLLLYDAWHMRFRELKLRRDPRCPVCGDEPRVRELIDYEQFCGVPRQAAPAGSFVHFAHPGRSQHPVRVDAGHVDLTRLGLPAFARRDLSPPAAHPGHTRLGREHELAADVLPGARGMMVERGQDVRLEVGPCEVEGAQLRARGLDEAVVEAQELIADRVGGLLGAR